MVAVLGKTPDTDGALAAELIAEMQMDVSSIRGKRESFLFVVTEQRLLIFGSDKRGTILWNVSYFRTYGSFLRG